MRIHPQPGLDAACVAAAARAEVWRLECKYSRYRDDSLASRIKRSAGDPAGIEVDPEAAALLDYAAAAFAASDGLFDNLHLPEIIELARKGPVEKACQALQTLARQRMNEAADGQPSKADDLTIITSNGVAIRIKVKDVRQAGRSTRGVHLIKPQPGDSVASVARIAAEDLKKAGAQLNGEEKVEEAQPLLV